MNYRLYRGIGSFRDNVPDATSTKVRDGMSIMLERRSRLCWWGFNYVRFWFRWFRGNEEPKELRYKYIHVCWPDNLRDYIKLIPFIKFRKNFTWVSKSPKRASLGDGSKNTGYGVFKKG